MAIERTPLDQIRHAEMEVTRRIAVARQASEEAIKEAEAQAVDLKRQARDAGHQEGQEQYQNEISKAEKEAQVRIAQAHSRAKDLRLHGETYMDAAVRRALAIIIGCDEESDDG
jgi:vacuolar-type H+-ATPase subunit H